MGIFIAIILIILIILIIPIAKMAKISNNNVKLIDEYIKEKDQYPSWLSDEKKSQEFLDAVFEFIDSTGNIATHHKEGIKKIVNEENTIKKLLLEMRELEKQGSTFEYQQIIMEHKLTNIYWQRRQQVKRLPSWVKDEDKKQEFLNKTYEIVERMNTDMTDSMKMDLKEIKKIMVDNYDALMIKAGHLEDFGCDFEEQQKKIAEKIELIYGDIHGFYR